MLAKKFVLITIFYAFICFCAFFVYSFFIAEIPVILERDVTSYKFYLTLLHFSSWLPSIIVSVVFVVMSTFIDYEVVRSVKRFSTSQMASFKKIFMLCFVSVLVIFLAKEILNPLANAKCNNRLARIDNYNWYVQESKEAFAAGDVSGAMFYIDQALTYDAASQEALELKEVYERSTAQFTNRELNYFPELLSAQLEKETDPITVLHLLERAREAFSNKDYFDAHYYSVVGLELGGNNNENSSELQKISLDAWEEIAQWSGFETDEQMRVFAQKREGYEALISGDALSAYYIYLDLNNRVPHDKDVIRYFDLSTQALLNEYFFIDETTNLSQFEGRTNVSFSITRSDGLRYEIDIAGITNVKPAGNFLKYLRDYSCAIYDEGGTLLYSFTVPYVKLIGQPLTAFSQDMIDILALNEEDLVPRLQLTSVDRNSQGIISAPRFSHGSINTFDERVTLLPMSLQDFDLVLDASLGPKYINLASLLSFMPKAESYGFSSQVYSSFFLKRSSYPFLFFAIFMYLAIQAWSYRLSKNQLFRFYWVLIVPFFTVIARLLGVLIDYGMSLLSFALGGIEGYVKILVTILIFVIAIIGLSIRYLSLYSQPDIKK